MAGELQTDYVSGKVVYFLLRSAVGTIWNGAAFAAYNSANYATYPITATEQGTSGYYVANMPAAVAGIYNVLAKVQAGGSPAETDITVGTGQLDWSGSVVETLSFLPISGTAQPAASGAFVTASLNSGQPVLVYSGQLSGQLVSPSSGVTWLSSGGNNAVWQVIVSPQGGGKTAGFCLKQLYQTNLAAADAVCFDTGASQTAFNTNLTDASGMWNDALLVFTTGTLAGESRIISTYVNTNGRVTFDENWTVAPNSGDVFNIRIGHQHTASQIADYVWNELLSGHRISGTAGQYLDNLQVSGVQLLSGQMTVPYSGSLSGQPISLTALSGLYVNASLNSGQPVLVYSGQLSGQPVNPLSGVTVPQSGLTFIASGPFANVPLSTLSGVQPVSGASVVASLYSGQPVMVYSGNLSGQKVELFSGNVVAELSGAYVLAALLSGQSVLVYSGQLSGQPTSPSSGAFTVVLPSTLSGLYANAALSSGQQVVVASGSLSGQTVVAGQVLDKSGYVLGATGLDFVWPESGFRAGNASGLNARQMLSVIGAATAGRLSGAGTSTILLDGAAVSGTVRITATVNGSGDRLSVLLSPP